MPNSAALTLPSPSASADLNPLLDKSKIFVFIERLVVVAVGGGEFFAAQTAA